MSGHPLKSLLVKRSEHFAAVDQVRHDQTKQGKFERSFLSLDWKYENGNRHDYGDCSRAANALFRKLDAPWDKRRRDELFNLALKELKGRKKLKKTLKTIRKFRKREKIILALKIKGEVYEKRFQKIRQTLKIST